MSPARLVAFLRGINLGNRRVKMDRLRGIFQGLGLEGVATYRASGNVVFAAPPGDRSALEGEIQEGLAGALGYDVATFLRPLAHLQGLVARDVVEASRAKGFTPYVIFRREETGRGVTEALRALESDDDRFRPLGREVLWLRRGRLTDSPVGTAELEEALGGSDHTRRKLTTVEGLVSRFG